MRCVSYKMSLWLHGAIDESQMDLWLTSLQTNIRNCLLDVFHQALKTQNSYKQTHYLSLQYVFFCLSPALGGSQDSQAITQASYVAVTVLLSHSFQPSAHELSVNIQKRLLLSNRFPQFLHPHQLLLRVSSPPVSSLWNTLKPLSTPPIVVHLQNPQMVPFGFCCWFLFVCFLLSCFGFCLAY